MMFDGSEYLVIIDYYSKMPTVQKMPISQCNSAKTIIVLKELFAKHGIPEVIWSDNGPKFTSHLFAEFVKNCNIKHTKEPLEQWTSRICGQDYQRPAYPCHVLWTGSMPHPTSIQEYTNWFPSVITCWDTHKDTSIPMQQLNIIIIIIIIIILFSIIWSLFVQV